MAYYNSSPYFRESLIFFFLMVKPPIDGSKVSYFYAYHFIAIIVFVLFSYCFDAGNF